jgi:hypothetical protein
MQEADAQLQGLPGQEDVQALSGSVRWVHQPVMEPYRPSRWELIGERRDWKRIVWHYMKQAAPTVGMLIENAAVSTWRLIKRIKYWILVAAGLVALVLLARHGEQVDKLNQALKERQDLQEARAVTERALTNWIRWRDAFLGQEEAVCFHAHDFSRAPIGGDIDNLKPLSYTITCQIGTKGEIPKKQVACDQDLCRISNLK